MSEKVLTDVDSLKRYIGSSDWFQGEKKNLFVALLGLSVVEGVDNRYYMYVKIDFKILIDPSPN